MANKVGRPSKSLERRAEILGAMNELVRRDGLAAASVAKVAEQAGLQRALVFHYFGDRETMVDAFITEFIGQYGGRQVDSTGASSASQRIASAFEPPHYEDPRDLIVWNELIALAGRDPQARAQLTLLWTKRWLPEIEGGLRLARPRATKAQIQVVAFGISGLVEGYWSFVLQGLDDMRFRKRAQAAAKILLDSLPVEPG